MLTSMTFLKDFRVFAEGETFTFRPGVNYIVGDQGSGKSTFLEQLALKVSKKMAQRVSLEPMVSVTYDTSFHPFFFDFEKYNPRTQPALGMGYGYDEVQQISSHYISHGEFVRAFLESLKTAPASLCAIFDEPDAALSARSVLRLAANLDALAARGAQIIASVHNPWLIETQKEVLSLEHRRWMPSEEFLHAMRTTEAPEHHNKNDKRTKKKTSKP